MNQERITLSKRRVHRICMGRSDEELAVILASTSDWDENKHADLTKIDYRRYKPYRSAKVKEQINKYLS